MRLRDIVAGNLRRLRRDAGLTQEELAHRAGFDRNYVGMLERGINSPTIDTIEKLSRALQIDAIRFLDEKPMARRDSVAPPVRIGENPVGSSLAE